MEPFDIVTTFGKLPIGTVFVRKVWARNTTGDRRYKSLQDCYYTKDRSHGTEAGFAKRHGGDYDRFNIYHPVYVQNDLRLLVEINRAG